MALALDIGTLKHRLTREKAQSGAITASLMWNGRQDLDLHAKVNNEEISFRCKKAAGGYLDVDMNANGRLSEEPVENIFWKSPPPGDYHIWVHHFSDNMIGQKRVPFKVFLNKDGMMQTFTSTVNRGKCVNCFQFKIAGSGSAGSGGGGMYIVFPPEASNTTFKDLCVKHSVAWKKGGGYYAVARSELIHGYKEMLLQDVKTDKFVVGASKCRLALSWAATGDLKMGPKDIPQGKRLFVQSTSANRVIPAGTHVLFEVSPEEHARLRKAKNTKFEDEAHTVGTKGMSAAAKAKAKVKAKAKAKASVGAFAKRAAAPKVATTRAGVAAGSSAAPARTSGKRAASSGAAEPKAKASRSISAGGLAGRNVVFTGTLTTPRAVASAAAKAAGATVQGGVTKTTHILVAAVDAGSKLAKAAAMGIEVWDEARFRKAAGL